MRRGRTNHPEVGSLFGRWTAISILGLDGSGHRWCRCRCECGTEKDVRWGRSRSCGCLQREEAAKIGRKFSLGERAASFHKLFNSYKSQAKRRRLEFGIDRESFAVLTSSPCYYCGQQPSQRSGTSHDRYHGVYVHNGIDRLNPMVGYVPSNCVPCCKWCNYAKLDRTREEFLDWVACVHAHSVVGHQT
jgi:hypothetical protein